MDDTEFIESPKKVSAWSKLRDTVQDEENLKMRNFIIDSVLKPVSFVNLSSQIQSTLLHTN